MIEKRIRVTSRLGLHARAAANLVRVANQFQSTVTLQRLDGAVEADAKSILSILMLAASRGTELRLIASGDDEKTALESVADLFARGFDEIDPPPVAARALATTEVRFKGLGVSEGIVSGRVLRLQDGTRDVYRAEIKDADVVRERLRFRAAVTMARQQLRAIKNRAEKELGKGHAYIFDAHLLFLEDAKLTRDVENYIVQDHANAEWATKVVGDRLLSIYAQINDEYLRERGSDIEDVIQRLLANLTGEGRTYPKLSEDAVIVAPDLLPSTIAELDLNHVKAIATDSGGWTSHMSIIARGLGLTAVVGLHDFYQQTRTGDQIIVDAEHNEVILHPTAETISVYGVNERPAKRAVTPTGESGPITTKDGVIINVRANVELPAEFDAVREFGAVGVGLFRSEFLLSKPGLILPEDEQYVIYRELISAAGEHGAIVRLFDIGGESDRDPYDPPERNPALGLRAIRFDLRHKEIMSAQVRAILRAAATGPLSLVVPMVADVGDVRMAKRVIEAEKEQLRANGIEFSDVRVGAMIEVPSAVLTADKIAREVDFFELGTNDLVQYTLAVDRGNNAVSDWFRTLHPAVLFGIQRTLQAAEAEQVPVIVCGEMASTPAYAVLLLGLGAVDLSMTPALIPRVRNTLRHIDTNEARRIVETCLSCATADEVEDIIRTEFRKQWPELFPPAALPAENSGALGRR
ncbi:MAG TPA: phosphoenolpyruvate--protein phosphotransferase [Pyrinomonadaceae bacterium]|nr:phosphoenolpyruvate--protein phosphotransferase [Pyrinomonadaceae bacterium]